MTAVPTTKKRSTNYVDQEYQLGLSATNGRLRGKQPKLSVKEEAHLLELHDAGKYAMTEMAELFSISRSTIYRAVERGQRRAAEPLRS